MAHTQNALLARQKYQLMASGYEVQVKLSSARDLKNVNWRNGPVKPYAVVWVDPKNKCSTRVDEEDDTSPYWDETLTIPLPGPVDRETTLYIDVVHAGSHPDTKPLIGSARLKLREVLDDVGFDERASRTLQLKRPSGRPQGKVDINVTIREPRYRAPEPYYAPPYGVPPAGSRDYYAPPPAYGAPPPAYGAPPPAYGAPPPAYGAPPPAYGAPPPAYGAPYASPAPPPTRDYAAPPSGYPYNATPAPYGQPAQASYGQAGYGQEEKKSKFGGMGTGLAVGAVAGVLGGLALAEGFDYVEDKIEDNVADRVEDDLADDGDDF